MSDFVPVTTVGDMEEVEVKQFDVDGQLISIAVVGDQYYAFDDTCTHEHCSLADGDLSGTTIICPCHDGEYDITTGEVLDGPPPEAILTYPVKVVGDEIQVEI
ncbi:MAG TPA: non-heme iron oxygenase ferredoxin subunit [Actinomycetota bacterium]|jgi:nitrite reductase/ring-hydroxylating ferredoxin subunit|nr:non-heme iron oxygenase ferredoxin subunit [Actinomycetota bacterium]